MRRKLLSLLRRSRREPTPYRLLSPDEALRVAAVTRPEDGHAVVRLHAALPRLDLRPEHARDLAVRLVAAADRVDELAPDQDWSYDPIRDEAERGYR